MTKTKAPAPCARCAALEDWILKALKLLQMISEDEEIKKAIWLQRQLQRAKAQCPITPTPEEMP